MLIDSPAERRRILVGFDRPDCAGKTTLADLVAAQTLVPVLRGSVDDFQAPPATRYRRGGLSPEGHYRDGFDYARLRESLLEPYANGATDLTTAALDRSDREQTAHHPHRRGALLVDGLFLLRAELRDEWTLAVYLQVPAEVTLARALERDHEHLGSAGAVRERYLHRYPPGQQELYQAEARPAEAAHIVIDNSDVDDPQVLRWDPPAPL